MVELIIDRAYSIRSNLNSSVSGFIGSGVITKLSLGLVGPTVLAGMLLGSGDTGYRGFAIVLVLDDGFFLATCVSSELTALFLELYHESTH